MYTKKIDSLKYSSDTRQKIIKSAAEVFIKNGFKNTTIKQITDNANIAYSTSYVYFRNKASIFVCVIDETINNLYKMARNNFFPTNCDEAYAIIVKQCRMYLEIAVINNDIMSVIYDAIYLSVLIKKKWDGVREYFIMTITQDITYSKNAQLVREDVIPAIAAGSWYSINEWYLWEITKNPSYYDLSELSKQLTQNYLCSIYKK